MALSTPSRSTTSYNDRLLSPEPVFTVTAVPAMLALTSGSTIMLRLLLKVEFVCPFASVRLVVNVLVVPPLCCPEVKLNVFAIVLLVSPEPPDPMLTTVAPAPSPKSQLYVCVALKSELLPGFVAVLLVNVTGKPEVDSSLTPLIVESAVEYKGVCSEYTSKLFVAVFGITAGLAVECVSSLRRIAYLVSPAPVPATVDPSSPLAFVKVWARRDPPFPIAPPATPSPLIVSSVPSPQSTSYVTVAPDVFVQLFCRYTVSPVSAVVIGEPPDEAAYMANVKTGSAVEATM